MPDLWHNGFMADDEVREPPGGKRAGRLRAAQAYARLSEEDAAAVVGVSVTQFSRLKRGVAPITDDQQRAMSAATGVPQWFFDHGWDPPVAIRETAALDRIATLERQVTLLLQREGARPAPAPPGATGRPRTDPGHSDASPGRSDSPQAADGP